MKKFVRAGIFSVLGLSLLLCGCIGKTKADIPDGIPPLADDAVRIILTRERQVAGAASTVVFIDIGENIDPNGIMAPEGYSRKRCPSEEKYCFNCRNTCFVSVVQT